MFDLIVVGIILSEMVIYLKYIEKYTTKLNFRANKDATSYNIKDTFGPNDGRSIPG